MAQTTLAVTATVTPDGGSPVALQTLGVYHLVSNSVSHGVQTRRRILATSNYVPGRSLVHAVPETQIGTLAVRVFGASITEVQTRIATIVAPFETFNYQVDVDLDGYSLTWTECEPADIVVGSSDDNISAPHLMAFQQSVTFSVPHYPGWS